MKLIITLLLSLSVANAYALDIVYRFVTVNISSDQIKMVGKFKGLPFMIQGKDDEWEMALMHDNFDSSCPRLVEVFPEKKINCNQKDRIALLDRISTDPQLQRLFSVRNGKPEITRHETKDYVLYSAFYDKPLVDGVTSIMYIKQRNETLTITGHYTKAHLKMLHVSDFARTGE